MRNQGLADYICWPRSLPRMLLSLARRTLLALALATGLAGCAAPEQEVPAGQLPPPAAALRAVLPHFDAQWAMRPHWEDGLAEVAVYDAERVVYEKTRTFELTQITVKEDFNQQFSVKTDDYRRADLFPVMKVNQFCRIPTGQYPYHYLTSLFFRREQPVALYRMATSSQEWCGTTFKSIIDDGVSFELGYHSYWDGQGTGSRDLRRDALLEDALPYTLRALRFAQRPAFALTVLDLQQTNHARPPVYYAARLATAPAPAADAPEPAWRVAVTLAPGKENVYWFAQKYPNVLLRHTAWDGRRLRLKSVRRYAYWQH